MSNYQSQFQNVNRAVFILYYMIWPPRRTLLFNIYRLVPYKTNKRFFGVIFLLSLLITHKKLLWRDKLCQPQRDCCKRSMCLRASSRGSVICNNRKLGFELSYFWQFLCAYDVLIIYMKQCWVSFKLNQQIMQFVHRLCAACLKSFQMWWS